MTSQISTDMSTVGGATILSPTMSSMLAGNMDLRAATTICRARGSTAGLQGRMLEQSLSVPSSQVSFNQSASSPTTNPPVVYFYDRDPEIFRFVLDYYRTGELHLPSSICGPFVRKELIFWGIDESLIGPCCMPAYMRYDEEKRTKNTLFRDCFEDIDSMQNLVKYSRGWKKWRYRMWLFMDHPSSSLPAKIWASCLLILMIASVMCYCLSTHENFRRQSRRFAEIPSNMSRQSLPPFCQDKDKEHLDCTTEPVPGLIYFDIVLNCLFTAEFLLKVLLAPDKKKFLTSIVSIIDMIILSIYWIHLSLFYYYYYNQYEESWSQERATTLYYLNVFQMAHVVRILRIFKISKISRSLRVLILTVKKSIPELVLLAFLLMNGMFLFSSLIYMAEYNVNGTFPNMPKAFWWSIITLTAVGYGDMHPEGGPGYLVGSITAICGCVVTGLAIPIIGNNFNTYYKYMKNQLMEDKYLKALRKDLEATGLPGGKGGIGAAVEKGGLPLPGRKPRANAIYARRNHVKPMSTLMLGNALGQAQTNASCLGRDREGLKERFKRFVRAGRQPFTRLHTQTTPSSDKDELKLARHVNSSIARKSTFRMVESDDTMGGGGGINSVKRKSTRKQSSDVNDSESRPSLVGPLTTDHVASLATPRIWIDGDDSDANPFLSDVYALEQQRERINGYFDEADDEGDVDDVEQDKLVRHLPHQDDDHYSLTSNGQRSLDPSLSFARSQPWNPSSSSNEVIRAEQDNVTIRTDSTIRKKRTNYV